MSSRLKAVLVPSILVLGVLAVFTPILGHSFVGWDDDINIHDNPYLDPASAASTLRFWKGPYYKLYIPLTYSVWAGLAGAAQHLHPESPALRAHPGIFHAASLSVHALNALLVYSILVLLLRAASGRGARPAAGEDAARWAALAGALVFGLHPVQVEPVAWASGMKDLLGGFFSLAALRAYLGHAEAPAGAGKWARYALATLLLVAALLAKPAAIALPLAAACLDWAVLRRSARAAGLSAGGWLLITGPWGLLLRKLQPETGIGFVAPHVKRPLIALDALAFYLGKLAAPVHLAPDYGRTPEVVLASPWVYASAAVPLALVLLLVLFRATRLAWACAGVLAAGLLPVLGLVPFQHQNISTVADRYLYTAMLGAALAASALVLRGSGRGRDPTAVVAVSLLCLLGLASSAQARNWKDTFALFEHTLEVNPRSAVAHNNLGHALAQAGRAQDAAAHYQAALALDPGYGIAENNLGNLLLLDGRAGEAIPHYERALSSRNRDDVVDAVNNLGVAFDRMGREDEAFAQYRKALELNPGYEKALNNLALLVARKGDLAEAEKLYRRALEVKPNYGDALRNLAGLLNDQGFEAARQGRWEEASRLYDEALRLDPLLLRAHVNRGEARLAQGDNDGAIRLWLEALDVLPRSPEIRHDLAVAFLRKGDTERARESLRAALKLAPGFEPSARLLSDLDRKGAAGP